MRWRSILEALAVGATLWGCAADSPTDHTQSRVEPSLTLTRPKSPYLNFLPPERVSPAYRGPAAELASRSTPQGFVRGDFDADGREDLAALLSADGRRAIAIRPGVGRADLAVTAHAIELASTAGLSAGSLDEVPGDELLAPTATGVTVLTGADARELQRIPTPAAPTLARGLDLGRPDGKDELVVAAGARLWVYDRLDAKPIELATRGPVVDVFAQDVDRDGAVDLLVVAGDELLAYPATGGADPALPTFATELPTLVRPDAAPSPDERIALAQLFADGAALDPPVRVDADPREVAVPLELGAPREVRLPGVAFDAVLEDLRGRGPELAVLSAGGVDVVGLDGNVERTSMPAPSGEGARLRALDVMNLPGRDLAILDGDRLVIGNLSPTGLARLGAPVELRADVPLLDAIGLPGRRLVLSALGQAHLMIAAPLRTFFVNTLEDGEDLARGDGRCAMASSRCSLRAALQEASAQPGHDEIRFDLAEADPTIVVHTPLPMIEDVTVDGFSEPDYAGQPIVRLVPGPSHSGAGLGFSGSGVRVLGLAIEGFSGSGLVVANGDDYEILGNWLTRNGDANLSVRDATRAQVGSRDEPNVLSGSSAGPGLLVERGTSVQIRANLVGLNPVGQKAMPNAGPGIVVRDGRWHRVGGVVADGNGVAANGAEGIVLEGGEDHRVGGNTVGLDRLGAPVGNRTSGIALLGGRRHRVDANAVAANGGAGISVHGLAPGDALPAGVDHDVVGNVVGLDRAGVPQPNAAGIVVGGAARRTWVRANVVAASFGDGITLDGRAVVGNLEFECAGLGFWQATVSETLVHMNLVGVTLGDGDVLSPSGNAAHGIRVVGGRDSLVVGNLVAANGLDGVRVEAPPAEEWPLGLPYYLGMPDGSFEPGPAFCLGPRMGLGTRVLGNLIGGTRAGFGNARHGISIHQVAGVRVGSLVPTSGLPMFEGNSVMGSGEDGIRVEGPFATGAGLQANQVGGGSDATRNRGFGLRIAAADAVVDSNVALGNLGGGLRVEADRAHLAGNLVFGNAGPGIELAAGTASRVGGVVITAGVESGVFERDASGNVLRRLWTGNLVVANGDGLRVLAGVRGAIVGGALEADVVSSNLGVGIALGGEDNRVQRVAVGGLLSPAGNGSHGIDVTGRRNAVEQALVVANAGDGVRLGGRDHRVVECAIGLEDLGRGPLGNRGDGVRLVGTGHQVTASSILGNEGFGAAIVGAKTSGNKIYRSEIGVRVDPRTGEPIALGNRRGGVWIQASDNTIGGDADMGNAIAYNAGPGVAIAAGQRNRVAWSSIHANEGLPIDLGSTGVDAPDRLDLDEGPNGGQNSPEILWVRAAAPGSVKVGGVVAGAPDRRLTLQLFASEDCGASGRALERPLGELEVATDVEGIARFEVTMPDGGLGDRVRIAATATDEQGDTSEASACRGLD